MVVGTHPLVDDNVSIQLEIRATIVIGRRTAIETAGKIIPIVLTRDKIRLGFSSAASELIVI